MSVRTYFPQSRAGFTDGPVGDQTYRNPFNDNRLAKRHIRLNEAFEHCSQALVSRLYDGRAEQVGLTRFLNNENVSVPELIYRNTMFAPERIAGKRFIVYEDGSSINVSLNDHGRPELLTKMGCIDNQGLKPGYTIMPAIVVDASTRLTIGVSDVVITTRPVHHPDPKTNSQLRSQRAALPWLEKESSAWGLSVTNTMIQFANAEWMRFISDQGSDIFEYYEHLQQWPNLQFIIRLKYDRYLSLPHPGASLQRAGVFFTDQPVRSIRSAFIPALDHYSKSHGKRQCRQAHQAYLELRYAKTWMYPPQDSNGKTDCSRHLEVTIIDILENAKTVPPGDKPIHWRIVTNCEINTVTESWEAVDDYTGRWTIEQFFRVLKLDGIDIERSQFDHPASLQKLLIMSLSSAIKTQQLVQLRDGENEITLAEIFTEQECEVLLRLNEKLEGATSKLKNPHSPDKAAYGCWVIGRLGGWSGYACEKPPGYKRMARGRARFNDLVLFYPTMLGN